MHREYCILDLKSRIKSCHLLLFSSLRSLSFLILALLFTHSLLYYRMAPPQAKAKKEQILRKYHNCGIIIETKTFVSDVPMTDCFYVTDTICISLPSSSEPSSSDDDEDETNKKRCKLILDIRFDIVFVKSTYFRSLIYRTTKNEMQQFMMNFTEYIIAKLAVLPSSKGTSTTNKATTNETDSTLAAAIISPITTKEIISSSSSSSNQPARGVSSYLSYIIKFTLFPSLLLLLSLLLYFYSNRFDFI